MSQQLKFKVLMHANQFVDETKLAEGIYAKTVPTIHNEKASIELRIEMGQKMVDMMSQGHAAGSGLFKQEWQDAMATNLRKCTFKTVTLTIED